MSFDDLIAILRVLNDSPNLTALHDEVVALVLKRIKKWVEEG